MTISDGLLAMVKEDCETCHLVLPVLERLAAGPGLTVVSQDDPDWPPALDPIDDTDLSISWKLQTETTPTLYRFESGEVVASTAGWHRARWEDVSGVTGLGPDLPDTRPGCGSKIFEPEIHARLLAADSGLSARRIDLGVEEDPIEAMFAQGWSDGLPLVPPTEDRVRRMLEGTHRSPDEVVCVMPPDLVDCTVEKVAINAVMAGCLPEYLPVVLAAVEAYATDRFNGHGLAATTFFTGPVVIVNGPIARRIGMNSGMGALGPGNRANATIGRALNLVVRNIGGSRPGEIDRSTLGSPAKYTFCFPEAEDASPWESLSVERGFAPDVSTVTLFAGHGPTEIVDQIARTPEDLARTFASQLQGIWNRKLPLRFDAVVVVSPDHIRVFRDAGWSKNDLRAAIRAELTFPASDWERGAGGLAEGVRPGMLADPTSKFADDGLWFVHAGGDAGLFSGIIGGWTNGPKGSQMTTIPIEEER